MKLFKVTMVHTDLRTTRTGVRTVFFEGNGFEDVIKQFDGKELISIELIDPTGVVRKGMK